MAEMSAMVKPAVAVEVRAIRCGCSEEEKNAPDWHGKRKEPCPNPKAVEAVDGVAVKVREEE